MIRVATRADVPEILEIYAPYVVNTTCSFEYEPPTLDAFYERFASITDRFPWIVWEEDGRILGYAYASAPFSRAAYSWGAEPSIYLRKESWGRGVAKKLYDALEELLRQQGFQVMYSLITEGNENSLRFHEKCGYVLKTVLPNCGFKFGRWLGLVWMEKRLKTVEIPSCMSVKWSEFMQDGQKISDILDSLSLS